MKKSSKAAETEREPLATPFEAAQLAATLAIMKGTQQPDLEGAVTLLRTAAMRVQDEKRPRMFYAQWAMVGTEADAKRMRASGRNEHLQKIVVAESRPPEFQAFIDEVRASHPALAMVKEPSKFPADEHDVLKAILGRRERPRIAAFARRVREAFPSFSLHGLSLAAADPLVFWGFARDFAPLIKKHKRRHGQKDDKGRFKKKIISRQKKL